MSRLLHIRPGGPSPLGSLEQRVMDVMWLRADRCTVGDVVEGLDPSAPSYSAVKAVLANLVGKKAVTKFDAGKAKSYVAASSRAEFEGRVMRDIVSPLYRANRALCSRTSPTSSSTKVPSPNARERARRRRSRLYRLGYAAGRIIRVGDRAVRDLALSRFSLPFVRGIDDARSRALTAGLLAIAPGASFAAASAVVIVRQFVSAPWKCRVDAS